MDKSAKSGFLEAYFENLEHTYKRVIELKESEKFLLESITVALCHIAALSRSRYSEETKDWKAFKDIVNSYSGLDDLYSEIDLLLFYQFQDSKLADNKTYKKLNQYEEIVSIFEKHIGDEAKIYQSEDRYQNRETLLTAIKKENLVKFDENNFSEYIELFSNNQILYEFARCEAVHNNDFPLLNIGFTWPDGNPTYSPNHKITPDVIMDTLRGIIQNLKKECLVNEKWPREL